MILIKQKLNNMFFDWMTALSGKTNSPEKSLHLSALVLLALGFASSSSFATDPMPLAIATMDYPHVRSILQGSITIPECQISYSTKTFAELDRLFEENSAGDIIEVDFASYLKRFSMEENHDWVLTPVFLWREFPHRHVFVDAEGDISNLNELAGKAIGVKNLSLTMKLWARGIISSSVPATMEYVTWDDSIFKSTPIPRALFPNSKFVEQAYFSETRIYPIITVLAIRKELVDAQPWLPEAIFMAFSQAKEQALELNTLPLPWGPESRDETISLMNKNYWSYGVKNNPKTLTTFFKYAKEQGFINDELKAEDVFALETLQLIDDKGTKN